MKYKEYIQKLQNTLGIKHSYKRDVKYFLHWEIVLLSFFVFIFVWASLHLYLYVHTKTWLQNIAHNTTVISTKHIIKKQDLVKVIRQYEQKDEQFKLLLKNRVSIPDPQQ